MVTAIVLIHANEGMVKQTAQKLMELEGISEVYPVAGPYDLVAFTRVPENEQLDDLVTEEMLELDGIQQTMTLVALDS